MQVSFYATLRQVVGAKNVAFELPDGATVATLLDAVANRFPKLEAVMWTEGGALSDYIKVFVDGREIRHLAMLETPLPPDAQVDIFPPSAGG